MVANLIANEARHYRFLHLEIFLHIPIKVKIIAYNIIMTRSTIALLQQYVKISHIVLL